MAITNGLQIVCTDILPCPPSLSEDVVRMVRHGLADVLEWLGEDVGPLPGEETNAVVAGNTLYVSHDLYIQLGHLA